MMKSSVPFPRDAFRAKGPNIYLDHNATTPVSKLVREEIPSWLDIWGNAGSIHQDGRGPKAILREARQNVANLIGCNPLELVFTAGGSESNNFALKGLLSWAESQKRKQWLVSSVEHPSLMKTAEYLASKGWIDLKKIPISRGGEIDLDFYRENLNEQTALVSVMIANNETGSIFPIQEMAAMAHEVGALFHSDGVQALGKTPIDVKALDVDLMSFSAHKFYSLKGCGALYIKKGISLEPLIHGGSQERKRRAGTENILSIAAFGKMASLKDSVEDYAASVKELRDEMEKDILNEIDGVEITGNKVDRICGSSSLVIDGVDGETLLMNLDVAGFSVSTGAACSSGNPEPSPVLLSMGLSREEAQASLRLSLGWGNTKEDIKNFVSTLKEVVGHVREMRGIV